MVRGIGDKVNMDTLECVQWRLKHPNCHGCLSELGCSKAARLAMVQALSLAYQPRSFEDFQKMYHRLFELQQKIIAAKTLEELEKVPEI